jgi:peptide/nickel transport system permease protein
MISLGRDYIRVSPYIVIFPGLAIAAATIGFNLIGEGLRNKIDIKIEE